MPTHEPPNALILVAPTKQVLGNAMHCFHHGHIVVRVLATAVQGIQDQQAGELCEGLLAVAGGAGDRVVYQIQLEQVCHRFEVLEVLDVLDFVGSEHESLYMPTVSQPPQLPTPNPIKHHIEPDEIGEVGKPVQPHNPTIIERQHLQIVESLQLATDFRSEVAPETDG